MELCSKGTIILDYGGGELLLMTNTLAYFCIEITTAVQKFIVQAPALIFMYELTTSGQFCETFYGRKLQFYVIS